MQSKNDAFRISLTEEALNALLFWSSLTEQEQETLRRSAFVRHYEKGAFRPTRFAGFLCGLVRTVQNALSRAPRDR